MTAIAAAPIVHKQPPTITAVRWPVCYAVIDPADGPASLRLRHRIPHSEFEPPGAPGFSAPRLALEVMGETGGQWLQAVRSATIGVTGLSARTGRYNRAATALAHRLGAPAFQRVYGPLILYGGSDHTARSLSDLQLRLLSGFLSAINASIHGPATDNITCHFGASSQCL